MNNNLLLSELFIGLRQSVLWFQKGHRIRNVVLQFKKYMYIKNQDIITYV